MRNRFLSLSLILFTSVGSAFAQAPAPDASASNWPGQACGESSSPRVWASAEYLLWWIKDSPLPPSLVLTGDPTTNNPGALNAGGRPILTGTGVDFGALSGMRVTAGGWLDTESRLGIEGSGFLLPKQTRTLRAASDASGNPVLGFRYFDPPVGGVLAEDIFQASIPPGNPFGVGPYTGSLAVVSTTRLWGTEANAVAGLFNNGWLRLQALGGFRYADLSESLSLQLQSTLIDGGALTFQGNPITAPSGIATIDSFQTRNQFYGGQLGARAECSLGNFLLAVTGKIALGNNHESINIQGSSTLFPNPGALVTVPTGQFAEPSNIGRRTKDVFAVLPEIELKVGYQVTSWMRATVGYDFMYLSRVARPGSQVDLIVDDRTNVVNGAFIPGTTGTTFPRPIFNQTDFCAQGLTFGLEFQF